MFNGIKVGDADYASAMLEAKIEFDQWERNKRKNRISDKAKFRAQRLAKLDAMKENLFQD
jgi:hypothetical protein